MFDGVVCVVEGSVDTGATLKGLLPLRCCSTCGLNWRALRSSARILVSDAHDFSSVPSDQWSAYLLSFL